MRTAVIIVAGGSGRRMGRQVPKQFLLLDGRPILMRCVEKFGEALDGADGSVQIVVVLPEGEITRWQALCSEYKCAVSHSICVGGATRFESVRAGLRQVCDADLVAVHDGVRALLSVEMIRATVGVAAEYGTAIPVVDVVDSLRMVCRDGCIETSESVDRAQFRAVQTPQIFAYKLLQTAYAQSYNSSFTDDASVVESCGTVVTLCAGEPSNIKITTPLDLDIALTILKTQKNR